MRENKERKEKFDPAPSGFPELDVFHWMTRISLKNKNGKLSWMKLIAVLLLVLLALPFVVANR